MKIIELNGKHYKEHDVVILDSYGKQSNLFLKGNSTEGELEYNLIPPLHGIRDLGWQYQFIYILSNDEIKKGDWYMHNQHPKGNRVLQHKGIALPMDAKKIISTNDESLRIPENCVLKGCECNQSYKLPQPSARFLKYFVEKYNTYNLVTKVLVEYEMKCLTLGFSDRQTSEVWTPAKYDFLLKVNPNNEIVIDIPYHQIQNGYEQFYPNGEECTFSSNAAAQICDIIVNQKTKKLSDELSEAKAEIARLKSNNEPKYAKKGDYCAVCGCTEFWNHDDDNEEE